MRRQVEAVYQKAKQSEPGNLIANMMFKLNRDPEMRVFSYDPVQLVISFVLRTLEMDSGPKLISTSKDMLIHKHI